LMVALASLKLWLSSSCAFSSSVWLQFSSPNYFSSWHFSPVCSSTSVLRSVVLYFSWLRSSVSCYISCLLLLSLLVKSVTRTPRFLFSSTVASSLVWREFPLSVWVASSPSSLQQLSLPSFSCWLRSSILRLKISCSLLS
jgi:hypothetical protein